MQYALLEHYLYDELTRHFIYDNAAGQKNKGPDFAIKRLKQMLARAHRKYGANTYAYTYDIKSFFGSTQHDVAKVAIEKRIKDEWAQSMVYQLIDSFSGDVGIGLGSDVAQFIELAVLDDLDHYIKEKMRVHNYARYMDDFIIITNGKIHAQEYHEKISSELAKIGLRLHPRKCRVVPTRKGFKFLGFRFRQRPETGKIIMTLDKKKIYRERRKLKKMVKISKEGRIAKSVVDESLKGWEAHAKQGNNHRIIMKMHDYYNSLWRDENV